MSDSAHILVISDDDTHWIKGGSCARVFPV